MKTFLDETKVREWIQDGLQSLTADEGIILPQNLRVTEVCSDEWFEMQTNTQAAFAEKLENALYETYRVELLGYFSKMRGRFELAKQKGNLEPNV